MKSPLKSLTYCTVGMTLAFSMALLLSYFGSSKSYLLKKLKSLYEKLDNSIHQESDINKKENTNALLRNARNFLSELENLMTLPETQEEEIQTNIERMIENVNGLFEIEDSFERNDDDAED